MTEDNKLNKEDIESLLDETGPEGEDSSSVSTIATDDSDVDLSAYDFSKPYSVSKNFQKNLLAMCEVYARVATLGLTMDYRAKCKMVFNGLQTLTYEEYHATLPNPTCVGTALLPPLQGHALVNLDLSLAFVLLKRLLGGRPEPEKELRKFTDIELGISGNVVSSLLEYLKEASSKFVTINPEEIFIESNPEFLNTPAAGESMILLEFEMEIEELKGKMSLCIPSIAFEPVRGQFDPAEEFVQRDDEEIAAERQDVKDTIEDATTELIVKMADLDLPFSFLDGLETGSVIDLGTGSNSIMELELQGKPIFQCKAGHYNGKRAVELTERITEED
ncbi:MAG: hypothetical protein GY752_09380 [bacterium]|nr:hypothetical protein [bacterium]MCP4799172.1 hypothetical protein [bacterium]